ncbi:MAG TPA: tRNA glutamyl-Q(34) synthetase GluQRS [Candidatus Binatia bacterium]|nr:tRNA glutamyl-Q(34) synthetase GluQRS [Candidatus Binatia bacterium]
MPYRGRLAPSPTGLLHIGHACTFWAAYQRAIEHHGTLILRNEDLDPQRSKAEFAAAMIEDLHWLGIRWQEGPDLGGPFAPYEQSRRRELYLQTWRRLRDGGFIYPCACSRRDLATSAAAPNEADDEPLYPGRCRDRITEAQAYDVPRGVNWRFRVPDGEAIVFDDLRQGPQQFLAGRDFSDFVVWRRDDVPAYQLAVVADDAAMQITEVVRGADLLKSTARQLLLIRALGLPLPAWYHCDLVRDEAGTRLAKRHDPLSLRTLRAQGYAPKDVLAMCASIGSRRL